MSSLDSFTEQLDYLFNIIESIKRLEKQPLQDTSQLFQLNKSKQAAYIDIYKSLISPGDDGDNDE